MAARICHPISPFRVKLSDPCAEGTVDKDIFRPIKLTTYQDWWTHFRGQIDPEEVNLRQTNPTKGIDPRLTDPIKGDARCSRGSHVAGSAHQESRYGKALHPMPNHNWGSSTRKTISKNPEIWWRVLPIRKCLSPHEIKVKSIPLYNPQNPLSQRYAQFL